MGKSLQEGSHSFLNEIGLTDDLKNALANSGENPDDFIEKSPALSAKEGSTLFGTGPYFQLLITPTGDFCLRSEEKIKPEKAEKLKELLERLKKAGLEITKVIEGFENENGNPKEYSPEKLLEISQEVSVSVEKSRVLARMIITSAEVEGKNIKVRFIKTDSQQTSRDYHSYGISYSPNQGEIVLFISPNARNHQAALAECALSQHFYKEAVKKQKRHMGRARKIFHRTTRRRRIRNSNSRKITILDKARNWIRSTSV